MLTLFFALAFAAEPKVTFSTSAGAFGMDAIGIEAVCSRHEHWIKDGVLKASVELSSCDTGMVGRNRHMLEALEAEKFPRVELEAFGKYPELKAMPSGVPNGYLTLHGRKLPVVIKREGDAFSFVVKYPEFGVTPPTKFGVTVKDEVLVQVKM